MYQIYYYFNTSQDLISLADLKQNEQTNRNTFPSSPSVYFMPYEIIDSENLKWTFRIKGYQAFAAFREQPKRNPP